MKGAASKIGSHDRNQCRPAEDCRRQSLSHPPLCPSLLEPWTQSPRLQECGARLSPLCRHHKAQGWVRTRTTVQWSHVCSPLHLPCWCQWKFHAEHEEAVLSLSAREVPWRQVGNPRSHLIKPLLWVEAGRGAWTQFPPGRLGVPPLLPLLDQCHRKPAWK